MQHGFDRLYIFLSWIFIHQVRYPWKACLFAFQLMPYLLGLFHWGACRVSKLGAMSKRKSCKIDRIEWEMHVMSSFGLSFCECMHAYPLAIHCTEILRKYRRISVQWMGSGYACIHSMYSQKESPKLDIENMHFPFILINFPTFPFWHCPQFTHPACSLAVEQSSNKASIERQINRLSRDIKLDE